MASSDCETVALTALRADTGRIVQKVAAGSVVIVTDHGIPVAQIVRPEPAEVPA